jgi:hypothetical protein
VNVVAKRRDIAELAPVVHGSRLPLAAALGKLCEMLSNAIQGEAAYPSRPELHRRLKAIEDAARLLMKELPDLKILSLLLDGDKHIENENEIYHGLKDMAARAARAREGNPRKQGRGKLYPEAPTWPTPMELCALMIATIYHEQSGRWPPVSNAQVHLLCEALWRKAAGGGRPTAWGDSASGWRNHLRAARRYRAPHHAGGHIEQVLALDVRSGATRATWVAALRPPPLAGVLGGNRGKGGRKKG